jgi:hypothetical protein
MNREDYAYIRGQWDAFNRILFWLNTLEDQMIDKKVVYNTVMEMWPEKKEQ